MQSAKCKSKTNKQINNKNKDLVYPKTWVAQSNPSGI